MSEAPYWVKVVNESLHMACMREEEVVLTISFCDPHSPGSEKPCSRCGIPLNEVPDP